MNSVSNWPTNGFWNMQTETISYDAVFLQNFTLRWPAIAVIGWSGAPAPNLWKGWDSTCIYSMLIRQICSNSHILLEISYLSIFATTDKNTVFFHKSKLYMAFVITVTSSYFITNYVHKCYVSIWIYNFITSSWKYHSSEINPQSFWCGASLQSSELLQS